MTITRVVAHNTIEIEDLNQLIDLLEGGNSQTLAFKFVSKTGENFIVKLADAAGARKFSIQDSAGNEVASIDSDGNASFASITSSGDLVLPGSTSPADTTEGAIQWDTNDDKIVVGTGASTVTFTPGISMGYLVGKTSAEQTSTSATWTDLATVTLTSSVPASVPLLILIAARKTAGNASAAGVGLRKLNTTEVETATYLWGSSATDQAENGMGMHIIGPRTSTYTHGHISLDGGALNSSSGANTDNAAAFTASWNAAFPTADITQVVIGGLSGHTSNTVACMVWVFALGEV